MDRCLPLLMTLGASAGGIASCGKGIAVSSPMSVIENAQAPGPRGWSRSCRHTRGGERDEAPLRRGQLPVFLVCECRSEHTCPAARPRARRRMTHGMHCKACHGIQPPARARTLQPPARARTLTLTTAWILTGRACATRGSGRPLTPSFLPAVAHRAKNTWPKFEQERVFGLHTCKRVKSPASGSKYTGKKYYLHTTIGN